MTTEKGASGTPFKGESAINMLRNGIFPEAWRYTPVAGKKPRLKGWDKDTLDKQQCIEAYISERAFNGIGVVTGEQSGGVIALDIDGPEADGRYKESAGDEYEPYGQERTMAWTSGKPGRRQIVYRIPSGVADELKNLKTLILQYDGEWSLGQGDKNRAPGESDQIPEGQEYEEVVLRFNHCQSVLPGSAHPEGMRYRFLSYNGGMPAKPPGWVFDALRPYRKPVAHLTGEMAEALKDFGDTIIPPKQIRGWFFKDEIQAKLMPRLTELVFNHPVFDQYGWKQSGGEKPQMKCGCPWHGGRSGTTFQFSVNSGCWDCKACGVHGDLLDFVHKIRSNNKNAPKPAGADLESYVVEITTALGYNYPEDARAQVVKEVPRLVMNARDFHEALIKIHDEEMNPALRVARMAELAAETGRRLTGSQCLAAMDEYRYYEESRRQNEKAEWWENVEKIDFLVPNLLMKPTQVMLHAAGGLGKTSACMGLAKAVGRGESMRIRGIDLPVRQGPVLWIQNDQNPAKLLRDCEDNGIHPASDKWFIVKRGFQLNHTNEFVEWVKTYRPALVIVDSVGSCSTKMQVEEKDKGFASPFYYYAEKNGNPDDGFPATTIIWIHHDNANGEARGTRYLVAAVDEQWHLRSTTDDEREAIRERGANPSNCRMIQIKKSRLGRQGDLLVVERDENFAYSVADYTPTERREDNGQGAPEPHTMALRIVKDRVKEASEEGSKLKDRMTAKEVWERLVEELNGQVRRPPSSKTVKRWLDRWVEDGVLIAGKPLSVEGQRKPVPSYTLPPSRARALPSFGCLLSVDPRDRLQENGSLNGHDEDQEADVFSSEDGAKLCSDPEQPVQVMNGHRPQPDAVSVQEIPVPESDLVDERTTDTKKSTDKEPHGQHTTVSGAPEESELVESQGEDRPLGGPVSSSPIPGVPLRGDEADPTLDLGSPSDPDVGGPGSTVQRHDVEPSGMRPVRELREYQGPEADYGDAFDD